MLSLLNFLSFDFNAESPFLSHGLEFIGSYSKENFLELQVLVDDQEIGSRALITEDYLMEGELSLPVHHKVLRAGILE